MTRQATVTEKEFQRSVIDLAHTFHWKCAHFRTALNARGVYMTPVAADGAGWPDLVLIHPGTGRALFRELKSDTGRVDPKQEQWGRWLTGAGLDFAIWRPRDMREIAVILSAGRATITSKETTS